MKTEDIKNTCQGQNENVCDTEQRTTLSCRSLLISISARKDTTFFLWGELHLHNEQTTQTQLIPILITGGLYSGEIRYYCRAVQLYFNFRSIVLTLLPVLNWRKTGRTKLLIPPTEQTLVDCCFSIWKQTYKRAFVFVFFSILFLFKDCPFLGANKRKSSRMPVISTG